MWLLRFLADLSHLIRRFLGYIDEREEAARLKRIKDAERAVDESSKTHDQRPIEKAIGSSNAGKPAVLRDGVQERPRKDRS